MSRAINEPISYVPGCLKKWPEGHITDFSCALHYTRNMNYVSEIEIGGNYCM